VSREKTKLLIASDHAGFTRKTELKKQFPDIEWQDLGTNSEDSVDYPDYADRVAKEISAKGGLGVLICGSGQGMAIRANRYPKVRAALCWNAEVAKLSREHNNANILCMGARFVDTAQATTILKSFLETEFAGGRHETRVNKLSLGC
jgi:ribose 5-phosphate isomerase B